MSCIVTDLVLLVVMQYEINLPRPVFTYPAAPAVVQCGALRTLH